MQQCSAVHTFWLKRRKATKKAKTSTPPSKNGNNICYLRLFVLFLQRHDAPAGETMVQAESEATTSRSPRYVIWQRDRALGRLCVVIHGVKVLDAEESGGGVGVFVPSRSAISQTVRSEDVQKNRKTKMALCMDGGTLTFFLLVVCSNPLL